jgi:SAM-dependent methyltransferase
MPYHLSYLMDELGYEVIATDLNPYRMPDIPRASGFDVIGCDVERHHFPIKSNSVSSVLFTEVLEHLRINPVLTLKEIRRVIKPGGKMLLTTPNGLSMFNIKSLVMSGKITDPYDEYNKLDEVGHMGHVREYTPAEVHSLLTKTGWDIEWSSTSDWPNETWQNRSLTYSLGLVVASMIPLLKKHQIYLTTPMKDL